MTESTTVSDRRRNLMIAGGVPLGMLLFLVAAWGIDALVSGDRVIRNVVVDSTELGGLDRDDIVALAGDLTDSLADEPVTLTVGSQVIETEPVTLGVRVDSEKLADDALAARRGGFFLARPFKWAGTFFSEHNVELPYLVDDDAARLAVVQFVENNLDDPVEPIIVTENGDLVVVPGSEGLTLDESVFVNELPDMIAAGAPYSLEIRPDPLHPDLDFSELEALAMEANVATADGVVIQVLSQQVTVPSSQLRSWVVLDLESTPPSWRLDETTALAELRPEFSGLGGDDDQARFNISGGKPIILPASKSVVCCEEGSALLLQEALLDPSTPSSPVSQDDGSPTMPMVELSPSTVGGEEGVKKLEELGVIEQVATFTTNHSCCENRVVNIQLMADVVRGAVIEPGATFSLNAYVGKRTAERGFLPAGAIAQGVLEPQIGGGVSQFATTLFNAAFFAGLELTEYQSHSLYFSRYPKGREATVSWPKPDLKIYNDTPYGVLIWPTYTGGSITVTMYSTKHITVEDVGRSESSQGKCTRVTTTRERTWDDGRTDTDAVFAVYRPGQGLDCNGNPTVPPSTTTSTTTEEDSSTTTAEGDGGGDTTTTVTEPDSTTTTTEPTTTTTEAGG